MITAKLKCKHNTGIMLCCLTSQEEGLPRQLVSAVYVYIRVHEYACVLCALAVVTSEEGGGWDGSACQQVNPALRLSIKLSDQRINNSDSSLSGSITEHSLRGRQQHDKGREVI